MSLTETQRAQVERDLRNEINRRVARNMDSIMQLVRDDPALHASVARAGLVSAFGIAVAAHAYAKGRQEQDLREEDIQKAMHVILAMAIGE